MGRHRGKGYRIGRDGVRAAWSHHSMEGFRSPESSGMPPCVSVRKKGDVENSECSKP